MESSRTVKLKLPRKLFLLVKEIGIADLVSFGLYQFRLKSGWLRQITPSSGHNSARENTLETAPCRPAWLENWQNTRWSIEKTLLSEEETLLLEGLYRPFYGTPEKLSFAKQATLEHWTSYSSMFNDRDIKFTWEPARFTWALALARAYQTTGNDKYPEIFWQKFEEFMAANPVNRGPNWASGQEVALRVIMWILAIPVFLNSPSSTPARLTTLINSTRQHIARILPTLAYARSQHNNHILSEALALLIGGDFLRDCDPQAKKWSAIGKREFEHAIIRQVDEAGNYSQHSANYHRMMLQLALLYHVYLEKKQTKAPASIREKLSLSTLWLIDQLDETSGQLPNLGHNDGTLFLPFGCVDYRDYRPTAQAAAMAFLGNPCLPAGAWDELSSWLGLETSRNPFPGHELHSPTVHKVGTPEVWASMRGVRFYNRPAHADQLHIEIWCDGQNLASDAGTYLYNAPPPWQNALDTTSVHNTVTIDGKDQMQRISRFLWLNQAQAEWFPQRSPNRIIASHNGYRSMGITHERVLEFHPPSSFLVTDTLTTDDRESQEHVYRLHWLLPDWHWTIEDESLLLTGLHNQVSIRINALDTKGSRISPADISLIRAGKTLRGKEVDKISGWKSDTYGEKHPALSYALSFKTPVNLTLTTEWNVIRK